MCVRYIHVAQISETGKQQNMNFRKKKNEPLSRIYFCSVCMCVGWVRGE